MKMPPRPDDPSPGDDALDALFAVVRSSPPDTARAEFGFETRLLARLSSERAGTAGWREFTTWCWRLLPGLAVVTVLCTFGMLRPDAATSADDPLLAAAASSQPADDEDIAQWMAVELLAPI